MASLPFRQDIRSFWRSSVLSVSAVLAVAINSILWIVLTINVQHTADPIPLHYNVLFGIDYLGAWQKIYNLPATGLVIIIFNTVVAIFLYGKERLAAQLLMGFAVFVQCVLLVAGILLLAVNTL